MLLRRVGGISAAVSNLLRRRFSAAAALRPGWAMIYHAPLVRSSAPRPSLQLLEPPCASHLLVPVHLVDPRPDGDPSADGSNSMRRFQGGFIHATSGDGLLLIDFLDIRDMDPLAANYAHVRAIHSGCEFGPDDPDVLRFVCNPLSGEMFGLPDAGGTKKVATWHSHGLLTHSARGYGPPDRYAVVEMKVEADPYTGGGVLFAVTRFLSETGKWEKVGFAFGIQRGLQLQWRMTPDHEVLAFAGRLWWVDVSRGAICFDPFSDQTDFRFVELPRDSVTDCVHTLGWYRRMGVSEGRLRYAEVSREEPFVLRSFVLNNDRVSWTLERRMELSRLWVHGGRQRKEDAPHIAVLDPLNANVIHITVGNVAFAVDMDKEKVLGCSTSPIDEGAREGTTSEGHWFFKPCVLPPWLESNRIPSAGTLSSVKANVKSNTLSDILVRVDRSKKN